MNFALANDVLRNPRDTSRVAGLMLFGGNSFGLAAPIITGYIVAGTGGYTWAFRVAAGLAICSTCLTLSLTRRPVSPQHTVANALEGLLISPAQPFERT